MLKTRFDNFFSYLNSNYNKKKKEKNTHTNKNIILLLYFENSRYNNREYTSL